MIASGHGTGSAHGVEAVVFGAGRTGRGLAAALCARSGVPVTLVDRDAALVEQLRAAGAYRVATLGGGSREVRPTLVADLDDVAWHAALQRAAIGFTAVVGTNLGALAAALAAPLAARAAAGRFDLVTCENLTGAARVLREAVLAAAAPASRGVIAANVGFAEAMVLTTSLGPADAARDPLEVRTQDSWRLPLDGDALRGDGVRAIAGLEPLPGFGRQLQRKIFTYNGINGVVSYLGAERGHSLLADAACDPSIAPLARQAGEEASAALCAEFGFDRDEQARWAADAMAKFMDPLIPDPIGRNAGDPARKLGRDDRLVGPALLALAHGIQPLALARGIAAAARYRDAGAPTLLERHGSLAAVLRATAGLDASHPLVALVERTAAREASAHG